MRWRHHRAEPDTPREGEVLELLRAAPLDTPAFVSDLDTLRIEASRTREMAHRVGARALFAMKSYAVVAGLEAIADEVDGFACSSPFEAQLARRVLRAGQSVHLTAPGLRPVDLAQLPGLVDYVGLNSLHQLELVGPTAGLHRGLRVNPQLSLVRDARYDPCRTASKLGIPLDRLDALAPRHPEVLAGVDGLQVHSSADNHDLAPLARTTHHLLAHLAPLWPQFRWVNLGGGYLLRDVAHPEALGEAVGALHDRGVARVFIEPGASIARSAGFFVTSVIDRFDSDGQTVAVLDLSVNHAPEVFEYQFDPWVADDTEGGHAVLLAGASCLAGDLFGVHAFDTLPSIGERVVLPEMGAYSHVKASMFNGIALPTLYALRGRELVELRRYDFDDYASISGGSR